MVMTRMGEENATLRSNTKSALDKMLIEHYSNSKYVAFNESQFMLLDEGIKEAIAKWNRWLTIKNMQLLMKSPKMRPFIQSKGDYTKVKDYYPNYKKVLTYLKSNIKNSDTEAIKILVDLDDEVKKKTKVFKTFFTSKKELSYLQFLYVGTVINLFNTATYLSEKLIEPVEDKRGEFVQFKLKEKSPDTLANDRQLVNAKQMIEGFRKGNLEKAIDEFTGKKNESFIATAGIVVAGILTFFITCRLAILKYYMLRVDIADRLRVTAEILTNNASTLTDKKVAQKQRDAAAKFRKWAEKIDVDENTAENKAERESSKIDAESGKLAMENNSNGDDQDSDEDTGSLSGMLM